MNKVFLKGNLGKDPEVVVLPSGTVKCKFSIATTEMVGQEKRTEWHTVIVFGGQAKACGEYLSKGNSVLVEGRNQTRNYEVEDGSKRYITEVVARDVQFLTPRKQEQEG